MTDVGAAGAGSEGIMSELKEALARGDVVHSDGWVIFGPPVRGRQCGACTACCTQLPVDLGCEVKPANVSCKHICSRGCRIYAGRPEPCVAWSCAWLINASTDKLRRPDQSGLVIDCQMDEILADGRRQMVIQVWVDPGRPDAHRDTHFRQWLSAQRMPAIVRTGSYDGFVLVPPSLSREGKWLEIPAEINTSIGLYSKIPQRNLQGVDALP